MKRVESHQKRFETGLFDLEFVERVEYAPEQRVPQLPVATFFIDQTTSEEDLHKLFKRSDRVGERLYRLQQRIPDIV